MFDATTISSVIGKEQYDAVNRNPLLPKIETMMLLHIWAQGSRAKLRRLAQDGELMPLLTQRYLDALDLANETRGQNGHLTVTECLKVAELPLTL